MTKKQIKTLVLFSQNYSINVIAQKQKVSLSTVRERIRNLSSKHPFEFGNAAAIRQCYKGTKNKIKDPKRYGNHLTISGGGVIIGMSGDVGQVKERF